MAAIANSHFVCVYLATPRDDNRVLPQIISVRENADSFEETVAQYLSAAYGDNFVGMVEQTQLTEAPAGAIALVSADGTLSQYTVELKTIPSGWFSAESTEKSTTCNGVYHMLPCTDVLPEVYVKLHAYTSGYSELETKAHHAEVDNTLFHEREAIYEETVTLLQNNVDSLVREKLGLEARLEELRGLLIERGQLLPADLPTITINTIRKPLPSLVRQTPERDEMISLIKKFDISTLRSHDSSERFLQDVRIPVPIAIPSPEFDRPPWTMLRSGASDERETERIVTAMSRMYSI